MLPALHIESIEPADAGEMVGTVDIADVVRRFAHERCLIVLESAAHIRDQDARYSFLTADPVDVIRVDQAVSGEDPFTRLRQAQQRWPTVESPVPFCGGLAGLMSYELGHAFERLPEAGQDTFRTPALLAGLFDWTIVWDHVDNSVRLCVLRLDGDSAEAVARQQQRLTWLRERLARKPVAEAVGPCAGVTSDVRSTAEQSGPNSGLLAEHRLPAAADVRSCFTSEAYQQAVERVIDYIRAGDIFQANLAQQMTAPWDEGPFSLYRRIREHNPAPFCGWLKTDQFSVISASPERFLRVTASGHVETRPIKGTRRRHRSPIADLFTGDELSASEKDRAENVMIVDLLRNDLSRVCRPGSVKVTGVCEIEVFETVQHLVSTVVGQLGEGRDVWDLCAAAIPGGSITGAPKIRAMEIIAELEPIARGAYCGNLFYLGAAGEFDSSILIRTFTLQDGVVQFPVGGGIVADSQPTDEYQETLHKAAGMLKALQHPAESDGNLR
ncbi:MAG: aminodeoxychorismate synthase component I [Planctomycetaceae bacterium]|nr:aminodeoxychorismate synthase component I [Planctomycetaceae bacterium]